MKTPTMLFGVGATKAGTTWLHRYLFSHPDCYLQTIKELHYFDTFDRRSWNRHLKRLEASAMTAKGSRLQDLLDWSDVVEKKRIDLRSYLNYLTRDLGERSVIADITPAYSLLPHRYIARAGRFVDVKMIYLMRDPVDRLWSQVRMDAKRASKSPGDVGELAVELMAAAIRSKSGPAWQRSNYSNALSILTSSLSEEKLLVGFYEEMFDDTFVRRLCGFLGIGYHCANFANRIHEGIRVDLPESLKHEAIKALQDQYQCVLKLGFTPPKKWNY